MIRRPRRLRGGLIALIAVVALALTGCTGFATSGPVNAGLAAGDAAPPDFSFVPLKPQDGASPEDIVRGFLDAGNGPENNWAIAQLFLAPSFRDKWKPAAGVTVDDRSNRQYGKVIDGRMTVTVSSTATVDQHGAYAPSEGGSTPLTFSLAKVGGQWRITDAPNGVVLGADQFASVFRPYSLMYFDPSWRYLVPDVRWFATANAATRIAQELIDGKQSSWLGDSVVSAFPENISLDLPSVPLSSGVAQVELRGPVLALETTTLDRMQTQLVRSLQSAGITDVSMSSSGTPLSAQPVSTNSTRTDARALVDTEKGFGFLSSTGAIEPVPGVSTGMTKVTPDSVELAADYSAAAVRTTDGAVVRVPARGDPTLVDGRPGLIDPTIDPYGYIWSVPGSLPKALRAYGSQGGYIETGAGWIGVSSVSSMAISRDGTRLAALVTLSGRPRVIVAGVVRNAAGVPQSIGTVVELAMLPGAGIDLTWLDDATLGVVSNAGDEVSAMEQPVGGPATTTTAPNGATTIAGGAIVRLRVGSALYAQRGSNWEQAGTGVRVLATQQGMPQ